MPTAFEYDTWATRFDEQAAAMTSVMGRPMEFATPETLQGGQLAVTVDLTLRASHENAMVVADRFRALAELPVASGSRPMNPPAPGWASGGSSCGC